MSTYDNLTFLTTARTRLFGFSYSDLALFIVVSSGISIYYDVYAKVMISLATTIPMALISTKLLRSQQLPGKNKFQSLVSYWSLHGMSHAFAVFSETLFNSSTLGLVLQFALSLVSFAYVVMKNPDILLTEDDEVLEQEDEKSQTNSLYDDDGYPLQSPPLTCFSDSDESISTYSVTRSCVGCDRVLTPVPKVLENSSIPLVQEDDVLMTRPEKVMILNAVYETYILHVMNESDQNVMWMANTDALKYVGVSPACGVIPKGKKIIIRLYTRDIDYVEPDNWRLVIDYATCGKTTRYSPTYFNGVKKSRRELQLRLRY